MMYYSPDRCEEIAIAAGARMLDTVTSFLLYCRNREDVNNTLQSLKRNRPELFNLRGRDGTVEVSEMVVEMLTTGGR
jgi:hypothetical protein